jgi:hypothetical protein
MDGGKTILQSSCRLQYIIKKESGRSSATLLDVHTSTTGNKMTALLTPVRIYYTAHGIKAVTYKRFRKSARLHYRLVTNNETTAGKAW